MAFDRNEYMREYRRQNPERVRDINRKGREKRKNLVFDYYGWQCACCGEDEPLFLTIDHINNDGAEHRRQIAAEIQTTATEFRPQSGDALYRAIIKAEFPDDLQTLCFNCNCGKERNGGVCPHDDERLMAA